MRCHYNVCLWNSHCHVADSGTILNIIWEIRWGADWSPRDADLSNYQHPSKSSAAGLNLSLQCTGYWYQQICSWQEKCHEMLQNFIISTVQNRQHKKFFPYRSTVACNEFLTIGGKLYECFLWLEWDANKRWGKVLPGKTSMDEAGNVTSSLNWRQPRRQGDNRNEAQQISCPITRNPNHYLLMPTYPARSISHVTVLQQPFGRWVMALTNKSTSNDASVDEQLFWKKTLIKWDLPDGPKLFTRPSTHPVM